MFILPHVYFMILCYRIHHYPSLLLRKVLLLYVLIIMFLFPDMLPQAIKISPEVILGGLAVNFSIPGQFGNHVPQFFFFTNVSTNAYLCKEKTTCGGDFMWTFVGANGTRLMRGLIWTEGKGEFWNSTLISLIGQSVTSYTIKWGKHGNFSLIFYYSYLVFSLSGTSFLKSLGSIFHLLNNNFLKHFVKSA